MPVPTKILFFDNSAMYYNIKYPVSSASFRVSRYIISLVLAVHFGCRYMTVVQDSLNHIKYAGIV